MNDKKIFVLAERVQKKVQEKQPYFSLIKKRNEIEKKLEVENLNHSYRISKKTKKE